MINNIILFIFLIHIFLNVQYNKSFCQKNKINYSHKYKIRYNIYYSFAEAFDSSRHIVYMAILPSNDGDKLYEYHYSLFKRKIKEILFKELPDKCKDLYAKLRWGKRGVGSDLKTMQLLKYSFNKEQRTLGWQPINVDVGIKAYY